MAAQFVRVARSKTDAGTGRMIPLNGCATLTLRTWAANFRAPTDHLFPSERYGQSGAACGRAAIKAKQEANSKVVQMILKKAV
jgi:hypothetical protein